MAQLDGAALLSKVTTLLADNTSGAISAADLREVLVDILDSFPNLLDDKDVFGFIAYDPAQTWTGAARVFYDGKFWVLKSTVASTTGTFDPAKWTQVNVMEGVDQAAAFDPATTYALGDVVSFDQRIWESLTASNTGNIPNVSPGAWQEISPADTAKLVTLLAAASTTLISGQLADYAGHLVVALATQSARSTAIETAMDKGLVREVSPGLGTRTKIYAHEDFTLPAHSAMRTHELSLDGALGISGLLSFTPHPLS